MTNLDAARELLAAEVPAYRRAVIHRDSDFTASVEIAAALRAIAAARSQAMREAAEIACRADPGPDYPLSARPAFIYGRECAANDILATLNEGEGHD